MVSPGFIDIHMHEESFALTKKQEWDIAAQAMALAGARMIGEPETMAKIKAEFDAMPK